MKLFSAFILLLISTASQAWSCSGTAPGLSASLEKHVNAASDIYLGRPINAFLISEADKIVFELEVSETLKGNNINYVTLTTSDDPPNPDIAIGIYYIIFLYGNSKIDFCGVALNIGDISSMEELKKAVSRTDYFSENKRKIFSEFINILNAME